MILAAAVLPFALQEGITRSAGREEIRYEARQDDCRVEWTVYLQEPNRGVIRHRAECGQGLGEQATLVGRLLQTVLAEHPAIEFRSLSWGRLLPDGAKDATMASRLALAARQSSSWNRRSGRPANGDMNGFIRDLSNQARIYAELAPVFEGRGLKFRLSSVEKALVLPAGRLPFYESLRAAGVRPEDKLPFDCQAWFTLRDGTGGRSDSRHSRFHDSALSADSDNKGRRKSKAQ